MATIKVGSAKPQRNLPVFASNTPAVDASVYFTNGKYDPRKSEQRKQEVQKAPKKDVLLSFREAFEEFAEVFVGFSTLENNNAHPAGNLLR